MLGHEPPRDTARQNGLEPENKTGVRFASEIRILIAKRRHVIVPRRTRVVNLQGGPIRGADKLQTASSADPLTNFGNPPEMVGLARLHHLANKLFGFVAGTHHGD